MPAANGTPTTALGECLIIENPPPRTSPRVMRRIGKTVPGRAGVGSSVLHCAVMGPLAITSAD
ncbi:hypothetical protein GCM10010467_11540 [Actinocorallia glomerata]